MYKTTSHNSQSRAGRILPKHLTPDEELLAPEERQAILKTRLQRLEDQLRAMAKDHPERKVLGKRKLLLQTEMGKLREKKRPGLSQCFMDAAFKLLPKETYNTVQQEAQHIYDIRHKAEIEDRERRAQSYVDDLL